MTTQLPQVHETVVDGVQTFWSDVGPPFTAVLGFRAGIVDEALVDRGVTHLVEHLALAPLRDVTHPYNGAVGMDTTNIWAAGSEEEVVGFFRRLTAELSDLSLDRLETEAGVLIAESMGWRSSSFTSMLASRFGPVGPGVLSYPEYGLRRITGDQVRNWASDRFTAENAVLWLTGPPPPGMHLTLPSGIRHKLELPPDRQRYSASGRTRIYQQEHGIAVGGFGIRSIPLRMVAEIVRHRAQEHMRHELGRVYAVGQEYAPLTADQVFVYWGADSDPEHSQEVGEAFDAVLQSILDEGPTQEELARQIVLAEQAQTLDPAGFARGEPGRYASDALIGHESLAVEHWIPQMREVAPEIAVEALQAIMPGSMAIASESAVIGFTPVPLRNDPKLRGKVYRYRDGDVKQRFILSEDAIAVENQERSLTIRFEDVILSEHYTGGGRALIDSSGTYIGIDATTRKLHELAAIIDTRVPAGVAVPPSRTLP